MLKGNLNPVQQLALQAALVQERKEQVELLRLEFKSRMIAAHPEAAKEIEKAFSDESAEEEEELTGEPSEYVEDNEQVDLMLEDLRSKGYSFMDG